MHHFVEKQLLALIGEVDTSCISGRSRNEQIATDLRLTCGRRSITEGRNSLNCAGLSRTAPNKRAKRRCRPIRIAAGRTVLVGHWMLAYVEMFLRDAERLADCRKRLNVCPLGIRRYRWRDSAARSAISWLARLEFSFADGKQH